MWKGGSEIDILREIGAPNKVRGRKGDSKKGEESTVGETARKFF